MSTPDPTATVVVQVTSGRQDPGHGGGGPVPPSVPANPKVEILFYGGRRLVFVNGRQMRQVLSIETPRSEDEVAGIVELRFIASEIVEREISREQFDALMKG